MQGSVFLKISSMANLIHSVSNTLSIMMGKSLKDTIPSLSESCSMNCSSKNQYS